MRRTILAAALALWAGAAGVAEAAQTIASPGLPTETGTAGACYLRNVGERPIPVQMTALLNFGPGFISPSFENCNAQPLAGGRTCVLLVNDLPDDVSFSCFAVVAGSSKNLRGSIEVREITLNGPRVKATADIR